MTRFGIFTVILIVAFIAAIGGAIVYGHAHSEPNQLQALGLGMCGDKACWKGITPGLSRWDAMTAIGTPLGGKVRFSDPDVVMEFQETGYEVSAVGDKDKQLVTYIGIVSGDSSNSVSAAQSRPSTIGDLLNMFGPPCSIKTADEIMGLEFIYPNITATVFNSASPNLNSPISGILVIDPMSVPNMAIPELCKSSPVGSWIVLPWRGLTTFENYQNFQETEMLSGQ